jgi:hypothetical protein
MLTPYIRRPREEGKVEMRGATARLLRRVLLAVLAGVVAVGIVNAPVNRVKADDGSQSPFVAFTELYGDAGVVARQRFNDRLANGVDFHPLLSRNERSFLTKAHPPFIYFSIPGSAGVARCYPSSTDPNSARILRRFTKLIGPQVWRLGMPEFDQGGGCWAKGRPRFGRMSDRESYASWRNFYMNKKGLGVFLRRPAEERGYRWMSLCVFAFCPQYAYDMGSDAVLLERNIDEVSGMTPGISMVRGASVQHGDKPWGIDMSTWRFWTDGPTVYRNGRLRSGWSASTFARNMYIAYMSGADFIHNEAADYTIGQTRRLNPLGRTVQRFVRFSTIRHPDRGLPFVPFALMQDHHSGFEPRFGQWMQKRYKWYWSKRYSVGDSMLSNMLSLAFPRHATWGSIVPGAPWKVLRQGGGVDVAASRAAYRRRLANGADPRPWEPMASSRWGESFDVITDHASLPALQRYRAVIVTAKTLTSALLDRLTRYVEAGGILILNARQLPSTAEAITGLHLTGGRDSASSETWLPDGSTIQESPFRYSVAVPVSASVLAQTTTGDPIVTRNAFGAGTVYVTTPDFLTDLRAKRILDVGMRLIDSIHRELAVVQVSGPPVEYLVNTDGGRTIVTLVNTNLSAVSWTGTLTFPVPSGPYSAQEWTLDSPVGASIVGGRVVIDATVPKYGVRVYAFTAG